MTDITIKDVFEAVAKNLKAYREVNKMSQPDLVGRIESVTGRIYSRKAPSGVEASNFGDFLVDAAAAMGIDVNEFLIPPTEEYKNQVQLNRMGASWTLAETAHDLVEAGKKQREDTNEEHWYNTFHNWPVAEETIELAATAVWERVDSQGDLNEVQAMEILSMLFDDLRK